MNRNNISDRYFEWLCDMVNDSTSNIITYKKLLSYMHTTAFTYSMPKDENRANNGVELRHVFASNFKDPCYIELCLKGPCSVLEMMIALAFKIENIMDNPNIGDRTAQWFWQMVVNMDLGGMTDDNFDKNHVTWVINRFLDRRYERDGKGGLFRIKNTNRDLRDVEIWIQMCWYVNNLAK